MRPAGGSTSLARAVAFFSQASNSELTASSRTGLTAKPRQVVTVDVKRTQTSCGYGVPVYEFRRERQTTDRGRAYKGS